MRLASIAPCCSTITAAALDCASCARAMASPLPESDSSRGLVPPCSAARFMRSSPRSERLTISSRSSTVACAAMRLALLAANASLIRASSSRTSTAPAAARSPSWTTTSRTMPPSSAAITDRCAAWSSPKTFLRGASFSTRTEATTTGVGGGPMVAGAAGASFAASWAKAAGSRRMTDADAATATTRIKAGDIGRAW